MKTKTLFSIFICCLLSLSSVQAGNWWDKVPLLVYTPRYFGANAFPIPEMLGGKLSSRWEVELRGEYHTMPGIRPKMFLPVCISPLPKDVPV